MPIQHPKTGRFCTLAAALATNPAIATDHNGHVMQWAWPGGYPVFHIMDHEAACHRCVTEAAESGELDTVNGHGVNYEDPYLYCGCGERIESAYAEDTHAC
jgi:hypothetical protein